MLRDVASGRRQQAHAGRSRSGDMPRPVDLQNSDSAAHPHCRIFPIDSIRIPTLKPAAFCQASAFVEICRRKRDA
jgi:hypothetical protein